MDVYEAVLDLAAATSQVVHDHDEAVEESALRTLNTEQGHDATEGQEIGIPAGVIELNASEPPASWRGWLTCI